MESQVICLNLLYASVTICLPSNSITLCALLQEHTDREFTSRLINIGKYCQVNAAPQLVYLQRTGRYCVDAWYQETSCWCLSSTAPFPRCYDSATLDREWMTARTIWTGRAWRRTSFEPTQLKSVETFSRNTNREDNDMVWPHLDWFHLYYMPIWIHIFKALRFGKKNNKQVSLYGRCVLCPKMLSR